MNTKYYQKLGNAFLAHYARRLADLINDQGTEVLQQLDLLTPSSSISTMIFLSENQDITGAKLAEALGVSHQMATQRINSLIKLTLIERITSPTDKRAKHIVLTPKGHMEVIKIKPFLQKMTVVFEEFTDDLGFNLSEIFQKAEAALSDISLKQRFNDIEGA